MPILDAQVHTYERNHPGRPWRTDHGTIAGPPEVTADDMVKAMDAVGVDGAILVSPFTTYGYDASYACQVYAAYPDRFALVKPVDHADPAVEDVIAAWKETPGAVAIRLMLTFGPDDHPNYNRILAAAARHDLPLNLFCWDRLDQAAALAARHPETRIVIDHLGLRQPFAPPKPAQPFAELPKVLALAAHDNVSIKVSGVCTISHAPYPYNDIWDPLARVFDAYGFDRCLWGTDWTRAVAFLTYAQGVDAFRLSDRLTESERTALMGETLAKVYRWFPA